MRAVFLIVWLGLGVLASWSVMAQPKEQPPKPADKKAEGKPDRKKVKELMSQKTTHSQKVLESLMKNDLPEAAKHAQELIRLRKEAAWFIVKTDVYKLWSDQFTSGAEMIVKAAKEKNYEVAKLGYLEMTMVCFHCHSYVRDLGDISSTTDD